MINFEPCEEDTQLDAVEAARLEAVDTVSHYCRQSDYHSAWDIASAVAKKNGWDWCDNRISGKNYAVMVLVLDQMVNKT